MEEILLRIPGDGVHHSGVGRGDQGIEHGHLLQHFAIRRQHHHEVVDAGRFQMTPLVDDGVGHLMGEDVDVAVRPHVQVVVCAPQVFPDQARVLIHLDQAVAPRCIAQCLVNGQEIAVGIEVGPMIVDHRVGSGFLDLGGIVPDRAERQVPFVQHLAGH